MKYVGMKYGCLKSVTTRKGDYDIHKVIVSIHVIHCVMVSTCLPKECAQKIVPLRAIRALCKCIEVHKVKRLRVVKVRVRVGMH